MRGDELRGVDHKILAKDLKQRRRCYTYFLVVEFPCKPRRLGSDVFVRRRWCIPDIRLALSICSPVPDSETPRSGIERTWSGRSAVVNDSMPSRRKIASESVRGVSETSAAIFATSCFPRAILCASA